MGITIPDNIVDHPMARLQRIAIFLLLFTAIVHAQESEQDSVDKEFRLKIRLRGEPTIALHYGFTQATSKLLTKDFQKLGHATLLIGYRKEDFGAEEYLVDYSWHGVNISNYTTDLWKSGATTGINTKAWQFGIGSENGDGYSFDRTSVILYRSSSYDWTRLKSDFTGITSSDSSTLRLYDGTFRFGQIGGMGVQMQFFPVVAFDAAFKRGVVFPRHLFLKHLVSIVVEEAAHGLVSRFIKNVIESSPAAGPVIGFLLHGGITYAIYELRKDDMHWPFATTSPVTYDAFSFGVRFNL